MNTHKKGTINTNPSTQARGYELIYVYTGIPIS